MDKPTVYPPTEILHLLIDRLADRFHEPGCCQVLATCALVSKALYGRAYQYLYSNIRLDFVNGGNPRLSRLNDALEAGLKSGNDLSLVRTIRSLTIVSVYERDSQDIKNPTWCQILAKILSKIQDQLESFALQAVVHGTIQWSVLGAEFIKTFTHLTHSPSFKALRLVGFTYISPSIFFRAANIQKLELRHCSASEASNDPEPPIDNLSVVAGFIQPKTIRTDSLKTVVNVMRPRYPSLLGAEGRPAKRFAKLTSATAYGMTSTEHINQFAQILLLGRGSLQHLHIVIEHQFTGLPTFPIPSFPHLRSLRVTHRESFLNSLQTQRTPPEVCRALLDVVVDDSTSIPPNLKSIEIETDVWWTESKIKPFVGTEPDWLRLARVLGDEKYRLVEVLKITLLLRFDSDEPVRTVLLEHTRKVLKGFQDIFTARVAASGVHRKVLLDIRHLLNDW